MRDALRRRRTTRCCTSARRAQIIGSADPRTPPEPSTQRSAGDLPAARGRSAGNAALQPTHLLSNGRYTVALRANGAGVSRWRAFNVTPLARRSAARRLRHLLLRARTPAARRSTSLTALPAPGADWRYRARFLADQVQFDASWPGLQARTTV